MSSHSALNRLTRIPQARNKAGVQRRFSADEREFTLKEQGMRVRATLLSIGVVAVAATGCIPVQIQAPDRPIEINLNVNIRQEVIVRLERDARELLEENEDLF